MTRLLFRVTVHSAADKASAHTAELVIREVTGGGA